MAKIDVNFRDQEDVKYELTYTMDGVTVSVYSRQGDKVNVRLSRKQFDELTSVFSFQLPKEQTPGDASIWSQKSADKEIAAAKLQRLEELKFQVLSQNPSLSPGVSTR